MRSAGINLGISKTLQSAPFRFYRQIRFYSSPKPLLWGPVGPTPRQFSAAVPSGDQQQFLRGLVHRAPEEARQTDAAGGRSAPCVAERVTVSEVEGFCVMFCTSAFGRCTDLEGQHGL